MQFKKIAALSLTLCLSFTCLLTGCSQKNETLAESHTEAVTTQESNAAVPAAAAQTETTTFPKYIFLFIGDGMSYPQIQSTVYYLGTTANSQAVLAEELSFMNFPVTGTVQTYDSSSFCPDSAASGTSIASGNKTYSGTINKNTGLSTEYETISEKLKAQMDYKIGIISSVNLNHATPAVFYAHQDSRTNYYEIGRELTTSGFDFFAGGGLREATGENNDQTDLYKLAEQAGYQVIRTDEEAKALTAEEGKAIVIAETLADSDTMPYRLDMDESQMDLADYVKKGIEVLTGDNGFFMMVEGGKIDMACHANDAASTIHEVIAFDEAVEEAIAFYNEHPEETLILVTGDHETGGMSIGYATTRYDTYLSNFKNQKISFAKYNSDYVEKYKENCTDFPLVLKDVKELFGLMAQEDPEADEDSTFVLSDYEYQLLAAAYEQTMDSSKDSASEEKTQEKYILYGSYEPLTVTITHLMNNKAGINYSTYMHTGLPVPMYAIGCGSEAFGGYYDNTEIYRKLADLTGVK